MADGTSRQAQQVPRNQGEDLTLLLLSAIEEAPSSSQRSLSRELGVALGTVNWHLKRCMRKGYIKVQEVPLKRYAYYITPAGFEEKSRLTLEYIRSSFKLFRRARRDFSELLVEVSSAGHRKAILVGRGDLAEAALLSATDSAVSIVAVLEFDAAPGRFGGLPVFGSVSAAQDWIGEERTAFIITDLEAPQKAREALCEELTKNRLSLECLFAPRLLGLAPRLD
jgi:DNA-binding MarR family transcriptional regulator